PAPGRAGRAAPHLLLQRRRGCEAVPADPLRVGRRGRRAGRPPRAARRRSRSSRRDHPPARRIPQGLAGHGPRPRALKPGTRLANRGGSSTWTAPLRCKEDEMLRWALIFLIVALIAAVFGFGGIAAGAAG